MNKGILAMLLVGIVVTGGYAASKTAQVADYQTKYEHATNLLRSVQEKNKQLNRALQSKEKNTDEQVKQDTEEFLKAFFVYDTSKGERAWTKITPFATQNAVKMLTPAGTEPNQPIENTEADKTILSDIDKSLLYYTAIDPIHANVFARVWQKITVNGQSSITQMPLDISLRYEEEKKRWMVDEMKIQQPLKENGYIN